MGKLEFTVTIAVALLIAASSASANPEAYVAYGRSAAMGGAGQSFIDGAAAIFHNPANLAGTDSLSLEVSGSPFIVTTEAPFAAPDGTLTQRNSDTSTVPFLLGSAAYRLSDKFVVGLGGYVRYGTGGEFRGLAELGGNDLVLSLAVAELAVPVSYEVNDKVRLGLALRWGIAFQSLEQPAPLPGGDVALVDQSMSGVNPLPGVAAGVSYQATPKLALGFTYRSQINVELDGTTDSTVMGAGTMSMDTNVEINVPHAFLVGASYSALDDRLLLAADLSVRLFQSMESLVINIDGSDMVLSEQPLNWETSIGGHLGTEYRAHEAVRVRGGYKILASSTPNDSAGALFPPPGLIHGISAGVGVDVDRFAFDLGGTYHIVGDDVSNTANGPPGTYTGNSGLAMLSLSYRR